MAKEKHPVQPRLKDDIGRVLKALAAKNGRNVPSELDFLLRPLLMAPRALIVSVGPNGEDAERSVFPSVADELEVESKGLRFEWDERRKAYRPSKKKR